MMKKTTIEVLSTDSRFYFIYKSQKLVIWEESRLLNYKITGNATLTLNYSSSPASHTSIFEYVICLIHSFFVLQKYMTIQMKTEQVVACLLFFSSSEDAAMTRPYHVLEKLFQNHLKPTSHENPGGISIHTRIFCAKVTERVTQIMKVN